MKTSKLPQSLYHIRHICLVFIIFQANAQLKLPEDPALAARAKAEYSIFIDLKNEEKYSEAAPHLHWLVRHNPEIHNSLYISGAKVLDEIIKLETKDIRRKVLKDSSMLIFDMRTQYFGDEFKILNYKMQKAYKYFLKDSIQYKWMLETYAKVYQGNSSDQIIAINTIGYFDIVRRYQLYGAKLTDTEVLDIFDLVIKTIDKKLAKGKHIEKLQKYKGMVINMLSQTIKIDCNFINDKLGEKVINNPEDVLMSKLVVKYAETYDCDVSESIMLAMELLFERSPNFELARAIARGKVRQNKLSEALKFYEIAVDLTEDYSIRAIILTKIGSIYTLKDQKVMARKYYRRALHFDPGYKKAYGYIGDLYYNSYEECADSLSHLDDKSVYIAAYEKYVIAGDNKAMKRVEKQFPSASEIHGELAKVGDKYKVGCWINETVILRKRPAEF